VIESFLQDANVLLGCHFTGIYDVNRSTILQHNDFSLVKEWADSIKFQQLKGIIFHNNFSAETCITHQNDHLQFVHVNHSQCFNPNVFRYIVYRDFLRKYSPQINNVFVTDVSDVVLLQNPFLQPLFEQHRNSIFCGDENKMLQNDWMDAHSTHLRSKIPDFMQYEAAFKSATLLNCGIIGGNIKVMQPFIEQLALIHEQFNADNTSAYTGDMGAFNYLARTQFNNQLIFGAPVNTIFKNYETNRTDCWFRHK
jgi:hypothetical protein